MVIFHSNVSLPEGNSGCWAHHSFLSDHSEGNTSSMDGKLSLSCGKSPGSMVDIHVRKGKINGMITGSSWNVNLVGGFNPSEKYESQLG